MKLFLDTADTEAIRRARDTGLLDGVTTNPSLVARAGKPFTAVLEEICRLVDGPVSAEAVAHDAAGIVAAAAEIARIAPNIVVKVPMTVEGIRAVKTLESERGIRTNVTMIFSAAQAFLAAKAGAAYVSIVLSRLDAVGHESRQLVDDTMRLLGHGSYSAEVIAGSVKTQNSVLDCLRAGVHIATLPESLFFQLFRHPLTDAGLAEFDRDWALVSQG